MTNKQDIVPVTLKSESQHQMNNKKTQTKSTVAFQVTKGSMSPSRTFEQFLLVNFEQFTCFK
ncbi:hypothetical protein SAMN05421839_1713 [Halolactibacillus halophilus]|uniref:Uncharacterized protein n=1 Tax=Halolactibacillus halophilus TaxID=306540 RepID=A0A1I5TAB9_9BACI|nr:hypothetical protein [Halolactibacillus halophilus]SFP79999.1 hypothetical protein SAMN05421839_1713 [Halolactibacillus halophilus]